MRNVLQTAMVLFSFVGLLMLATHATAEEKKPEPPSIEGFYGGSTSKKIHLNAFRMNGDKQVNEKTSSPIHKDAKFFLETIKYTDIPDGKGKLVVERTRKEATLKEYKPNAITHVYLNKEGEVIKVLQYDDQRPIVESLPSEQSPMPEKK